MTFWSWMSLYVASVILPHLCQLNVEITIHLNSTKSHLIFSGGPCNLVTRFLRECTKYSSESPPEKDILLNETAKFGGEFWRLNFINFQLPCFWELRVDQLLFRWLFQPKKLSNCSFGPFSAQKECRSFLGDVEFAWIWGYHVMILLMEEFLHQLIIGSLSHYLQGFIHSTWCRISSNNRISWFIINWLCPCSSTNISMIQQKKPMEVLRQAQCLNWVKPLVSLVVDMTAHN